MATLELIPAPPGTEARPFPLRRPVCRHRRHPDGARGAGGTCVYSVEIDRARGRPTRPTSAVSRARDIHDVDTADLPAYDVLAAGFPCQPFSIAGVCKKLSLGREHGFDDEKSGNLFFEIVRLIDEADASRRSCSSRTSRTSGRTTRETPSGSSWPSSTGWATTSHTRRRRAAVGAAAPRAHLHRRLPAQRVRGPQVPIPRRSQRIQPDDCDRSLSPVRPRSTCCPSTSGAYLQDYAAQASSAGQRLRVWACDGMSVARTLSARYYKDGSEILVDTGSELPRRLTPTECARRWAIRTPARGQSTPLAEIDRRPGEFIIPVSDTQAYKQFGNSVVIPVIEHLGKALVEQLAPTELWAEAS